MDTRSTNKTKIIKRRPRIKIHKATVFMILDDAKSILKRDYKSTDKVFVIKTNKKFSGKQWAKLMIKFQRELDKMTGDLVSGLGHIE